MKIQDLMTEDPAVCTPKESCAAAEHREAPSQAFEPAEPQIVEVIEAIAVAR